MTGVAEFALYGLSAIACAIAGIVVLRSEGPVRVDRGATVSALMVSAAWCGAVSALGSEPPVSHLLEIARNATWIYALYRHFANDGRDETVRMVRPVALTLAMVEGLQLLLLAVVPKGLAVEVSALLHMLVAVGALVLMHNLFGGAVGNTRRLLAWSSGGQALFWAFELNLFTVAYLTGDAVVGMDILRAIVMAALAASFVIGAQGRAGLSFRPSRAVTFSSLSLAVLAVYFLAMVGLANGVARLSGDLARVTQVGFLLGAATVSLLWLPSRRLRDLARVLVLKHLFKHRYDYREEWMRFTRTIGSAAAQGSSLHERAVQSLADIADSPAGLLFTPQDDGDLALAARWRWPAIEVPSSAMPASLARLLEKRALIIDFDEVRAGIDHAGEALLVPSWLRGEERAWASVPLLHGERLVGVVVLARPQLARGLDWEDFDLLGIAGQQVASYLAEQSGQDALADAERFDQFNRRMAFVMHDIKNLSSQFGLLARNAERHAENPDFRADMLVTLRNSADKLDALVSRLGRYGRGNTDALVPIDLGDLIHRLAKRYGATHRIDCIGEGVCEVLATSEPLEQALGHLIQNAIEASPPEAPIVLEVRNSALRGEIAVIDVGKGMSPQFLRHDLFRPFVSTKENGFGIGACEARELIKAMGGRLDVESRESLGSRFVVSLPLAEASRLLARRAGLRNVQIEDEAA